MQENERKLAELRKRVEDLARYQDYFVREMTEIRRLFAAIETEQNQPEPVIEAPAPTAPTPEPVPVSEAPPTRVTPPAHDVEIRSDLFASSSDTVPRTVDLEKFIGGNLIAKIGVIITVIGVAIGAKYAIDNGWITPVMRIVFGYLIGIGLLFSALRLRERYEKLSAVTLSGSIAIFYFISYAAYSFYGLFPQTLAFVLMVGFTAFSVLAATKYNRVLIAHFGMVGAYAVPFLLSENEGRVGVLFSYILIINLGILAVSLKKYWVSLFYSSFAFTWLIFHAWYAAAYKPEEHFAIAIGFATAFFAVFYVCFLAWKLIVKEPFGPENVALVLANSFVFFGVGYAILNRSDFYGEYLGLFAIANAAVHFCVAAAIFRNPRTPDSVINLIVGLVIVFITIAVPIQLKGHWITLIWITEAVVLFVIGRAKRIALYEWFSYPLMLLATFSLGLDWLNSVELFRRAGESEPIPLWNSVFLSNLLYIFGGSLILYSGSKWSGNSVLPENSRPVARMLIGAVLAFVIYNTFRMEIGNYWSYGTGVTDGVADSGSLRTNRLWSFATQLDYSLLFASAVILANRRFFRSQALAWAGIIAGALFLLVSITAGFEFLSDLRALYLVPSGSETVGSVAVTARYLMYACIGLLLWAIGVSAYDPELPENPPGSGRRIAFNVALNFIVLVCLSSELMNIFELAGIADGNKLGLSLLWGLYALALIAIGIVRRAKHLRIAALVLFGISLVKLFVYDLSDLGTIAKTTIFVSLGILMLVAGYFYNRFESLIFKDNEP